MSILGNVKTDNSVEDKDTLGGGFIVDTGVHKMMIELAYIEKMQSGSVAMHLHLKSVENGALVRTKDYIVSSDAKGNKTTYTDKETGKELPLPSFSLMTSLAQVTAGCNIEDLTEEERVVERWDFDTSSNVPQKTTVLKELIDKPVQVGIIRQKVHKRKEVDGNWIDTPEVKEENKVEKFFRAADGLTQTEIKAGATEASFKQKWADRYGTDTIDKTDPELMARAKSAENANTAASAERQETQNNNLFG